MVTCLTHLWKYLEGTSELSMTSFSFDPKARYGNLRMNVYVDASFSGGGGRSRSGAAMYPVDAMSGSESIIQWASRRQTSMATFLGPRGLRKTAMAEGYATSIFLFDALKEIKVIKGFGPTCLLSLKTDSAAALKQLNTPYRLQFEPGLQHRKLALFEGIEPIRTGKQNLFTRSLSEGKCPDKDTLWPGFKKGSTRPEPS